MSQIVVLLLSLGAFAAAYPYEGENQAANFPSTAQPLQVGHVQDVQFPPVYVPSSQQAHIVYIPAVQYESHSGTPSQPFPLTDQFQPNQQHVLAERTQQSQQFAEEPPLALPEHFQYLPTYQQEAVHQAVHNPPPAPVGSSYSYVATLSYGPGYPTISYHCYIPGKHPAPPSGYLVKGSSGYMCAVSYHNPGNYHIVHLINGINGEKIQSSGEPVQGSNVSAA